ncbi:MAG TPA: sugar phosphate isomerase/epimerase family protein [Spirochaetia bacterium]|nr:sugar phosphate isomerase/epimerase family protein [Spirochaetia bacterium]
MHAQFPFRLSVQTVLPPDFESSEPFRRSAEGLRDLGLWGIELNIADLDDSRTKEPDRVVKYLDRFGLKLSMFASGLTAKTLGISLSAVDDGRRAEAVRRARRMIDWTAGASTGGAASAGGASGAAADRRDERTGIIIGFLKGGVSAQPEKARESLVASLAELLPYAGERGVPLLLEATNRYESSLANSLSDAARIIDDALAAAVVPSSAPGAAPAGGASDGASEWGRTILQILPDTFHMNIEESDMADALTRHAAYFSSLHLSDNNRLFPSYGAIDFKKVFAMLDGMSYRGRLAIEGNLKKDLVSDLRDAVAYLTSVA